MPFWRLWSLLTLASVILVSSAPAQTGLVVSPTQVGLFVQTGSQTPATATIGVSVPTPATPFTAVVQHLGSTPNWLTVSPASGVAPVTLTLTANGSALPPGSYQARVQVSAAGLGQSVLVTLTVGGAPGGIFGVSPTSLTFSVPAGMTTVDPQALSITQAAAQTGFRVEATSSGWLTVHPLTGTTPGVISVEVFPAGLAAGRYDGTVSIYPLTGGVPTIVPVTLLTAGGAVEDRFVLSQSQVRFHHQSGQITPPAGQPVTVDTLLQIPQQFTATTTTPWLRLTSDFEGVPSQSVIGFAQIAVLLVNPLTLPLGDYTGSVIISAPGMPTATLPVALTVTESASLNALPSSLVLNAAQTTPVTVAISSTSAPLAFTVTTATTSGGGWLFVSPSQGATTTGPQNLSISTSSAHLLPGTYTGSVNLHLLGTPSPSPPDLSIPVTLNVTGVMNEDTLLATPSTLNLSAIVGGIDPIELLTVTVNGRTPTHPFIVSATSEGGWLIVDPLTGMAPTRLQVSAKLANVAAPGTLPGTIVLTSTLTGTQTTVNVNLDLRDQIISASPTSVEFVQPRRGEQPPPVTIHLDSSVRTNFELLGAPDWVRVDQPVGRTPADIQIWAPITAAPPGTNDVIRFAGPKNQITIPVSFRAADPAAATVTPQSVTLQYAVGQPTLPTQQLSIASGGEPGPFTIAIATESGGDWLLASPVSGTTPGTVQLTINPLLLAPNTYKATVTITVNNGAVQTLSVPVELMVGSPSAAIQSIIHAATLAPTAVAPGQIFSILGSGLGPLLAVTGRPNAAGAYETQLAGTRVLFDNTPAPLLFLRNDQINAIVPYSVYGRVSTMVRIEQGSNWSLPLELRVAESVPGVFTANGSGRGQAAAVNADLTANSVSNPAAAGSVISVYITGEGQTDPPGNDGRVILTDIRRPILPVTARIGGREVSVLYAGSAPTQVSGMTQVNLLIPTDMASGVQPLEIQVGSAVSQTAVTIAVR